MKRITVPSLVALATAAALLSGCSASAPDANAAPGTDQSLAATAEGAFPATVTNCGREVTLDAAPQRILLVNSDPIPLLESLDALDRVIGLTAELQPDIYADAVYTELADAEQLATEKNSTGGSVVTPEAILALEPDLVIAPDAAVDRDGLAEAGIATYSPPAYCAEPDASLQGPASYDRVYAELASYGTLLGESELAESETERLKGVVEAIGGADADLGTAAALYVSSTGVLSAYGASSMITPLFEAAGLTNVYGDETQRVFDISAEDLLSRNPETIVLLHSGPAEDTLAGFAAAPGVESLAAVQNNRVLALPFPFTDPPTPMSIAGAERLAAEIAALP